MENTKRTQACIPAAILFLAAATFALISSFLLGFNFLNFLLILLFTVGGYALVGVAAIMGKRDLIALIGSLLMVTGSFIGIIRYFVNLKYTGFNFLPFCSNLFGLSAAVFFALVAFGAFKPAAMGGFASKMWFLAGIFEAVAALCATITNIGTAVNFSRWGAPGGLVFYYVLYIIIPILLTVAFFLGAKWLADGVGAPAPAKAAPQPQPQQVPPQGYAPVPPQGYAPAQPQQAPPQGYAPARPQPVPPQGYAMPPQVMAQLQSWQAAVQNGAMTMEEYEARRQQLMAQGGAPVQPPQQPPVPPQQPPVPPQGYAPTQPQQVPPQGYAPAPQQMPPQSAPQPVPQAAPQDMANRQ